MKGHKSRGLRVSSQHFASSCPSNAYQSVTPDNGNFCQIPTLSWECYFWRSLRKAGSCPPLRSFVEGSNVVGVSALGNADAVPETLGETSLLVRLFFPALVSACNGSLVAEEVDMVVAGVQEGRCLVMRHR